MKLAPLALPTLARHQAWLPALLEDAYAVWSVPAAPRHQQRAATLLRLGHWKLIPTRCGRLPYMFRFWLSTPRSRPDGEAESGGAALLHWMLRGDDDRALHDHPWPFEAEVLQGGYHEHLPPEDWVPGDIGPAWNERIVRREVGSFVKHDTNSLHCVGELLDPAVRADGSIDVRRGSWSQVDVGDRVDGLPGWGFHPPGEAWVDANTFLDNRKAPSDA